MSQGKDVHAEWQRLCEEHKKAHDDYLKAFARVNERFSSSGPRGSNENPGRRELSDFDETWEVLEDSKKRMEQFVKDNA